MAPLLFFCTVEIPTEKLNHILENAAINTEGEDLEEVWLVDDRFLYKQHEFTYDTCTELPTSTFSSPFIGYSMEQVVELVQSTPRHDALSQYMFAVIDERTLRDGSILLVDAAEQPTGEVLDTLRCMPYRACRYLAYQNAGLGERWGEMKQFEKPGPGGDIWTHY